MSSIENEFARLVSTNLIDEVVQFSPQNTYVDKLKQMCTKMSNSFVSVLTNAQKDAFVVFWNNVKEVIDRIASESETQGILQGLYIGQEIQNAIHNPAQTIQAMQNKYTPVGKMYSASFEEVKKAAEKCRETQVLMSSANNAKKKDTEE